MIYYIDPGTGSMLITLFVSLLGTILYFFKNMMYKLRYFSRDKTEDSSNDKSSIVIFSDHKRYWNIFEPICDELEKRKIQARYLTQSEDDPVFEKKYENIKAEFIGEGNKGFMKLNHLNANILLSTTPSLDVFQWKRSPDVDCYIHIPHTPSDINMYKMFGIDYYDAILLSGEFQEKQVRELEKLRNLPEKELYYVGLPYMDKMVKRIENLSHEKNENMTILLAPSWGDNGILKKYGSDFIRKLIDTDYNIIIRPHPQSFVSEKEMMDELLEAFPENDRLHWDKGEELLKTLNKSDILISDFSGVIFEYTLAFDKPVLYTKPEYDKSTYDCAWSEEEPWTFSVLPEVGYELKTDDFDKIDVIVKKVLSSDEYAEGREKARSEAWLYKGVGVQRTVDFLERKLQRNNDNSEATESDTAEVVAALSK